VARAAGHKRTNEPVTSKACRSFLLLVGSICHRLAMTEPIKSQWDRHASRFSTDWYLLMVRRGKVIWVNAADCGDIEHAIDELPIASFEQNLMKRDLLLVEAALGTSRRIVTLDSTVRDLFVAAESAIPRLQFLYWLDPTDGDRPPGRSER